MKDYIPLVNGFGLDSSATGGATGLGAFVNQAFTLFIGLLGIMAVLWIIIGGFQYVSSDAWSTKDSGKKRIQAALGGLILALLSYVILNTIDPGLTTFDFSVNQIKDLRPAGNALTADGVVSPSGGVGGLNSSAVTPLGPGESSGGIALQSDGSGGYVVKSAGAKLDTDGKPNPNWNPDDWDPDYRAMTSYTVNGQYLDAYVDRYVVIPTSALLSSNYPNGYIRLGSTVSVTNNDTGKTVNAIVGDVGPAFGEVSAALARDLGIWDLAMYNSVDEPAKGLTFKFQGGR